jgi:hypothetical protein
MVALILLALLLLNEEARELIGWALYTLVQAAVGVGTFLGVLWALKFLWAAV